jgi:hypothetical protein
MSCIMRSSVAGALEHVMRLCWADKVPLALFALITLFMLVLGAGANPDNSQYCKDIREIYPTWTSADSYCFVTAAEHWSAFFSIEWALFLKIVAPIWAITRLIDLFGGGPAIRREYRESLRTNAPPRTTADIDLAPAEWTREEPDWRRRLRRQV